MQPAGIEIEVQLGRVFGFDPVPAPGRDLRGKHPGNVRRQPEHLADLAHRVIRTRPDMGAIIPKTAIASMCSCFVLMRWSPIGAALLLWRRIFAWGAALPSRFDPLAWHI